MSAAACRPGRPPRLLRSLADAATAALMAALGVALGIVGSFTVAAGPRPGGTLLSVGVMLAVFGNVAVVVLGGQVRGRLGAVLPVGTWLLTVLILGSHRPAGSLLFPAAGDLAVPSLLFLLGGVLAGTVPAVVVVTLHAPGRRNPT